jgi:hypothetical protein
MRCDLYKEFVWVMQKEFCWLSVTRFRSGLRTKIRTLTNLENSK